MNCTRSITTPTLLSKQPATHVFKTLNARGLVTAASRPTFVAVHTQWSEPRRQFSTTHKRRLGKSNNWMIKEFVRLHIDTTSRESTDMLESTVPSPRRTLDPDDGSGMVASNLHRGADEGGGRRTQGCKDVVG